MSNNRKRDQTVNGVRSITFDEVSERLCEMLGRVTRVDVEDGGLTDSEMVAHPDLLVERVELLSRDEGLGKAIRLHLQGVSSWYSATIDDRLLQQAQHDGEALALTFQGTTLRIFDAQERPLRVWDGGPTF